MQADAADCINEDDVDFKGNMAFIKGEPLNGMMCYFHAGEKLLAATPYKDGLKDGLEKTYLYRNGQMSSETPYKNGEKDGLAKTYFDNGQLRSELHYKNGKREGDEKTYREDGTPQLHIIYENGRGISGTCTQKNGKKVALTQEAIGTWWAKGADGGHPCP